MKNHEWHEHDTEAGEKRFYRAGKFSKKWTVMTTLKSDTDWTTLDPVPLETLESLRTVLLNKYQRRRIPYEDLLVINQMIEEAGGPPALGRN